jgi:hypothetical protein
MLGRKKKPIIDDDEMLDKEDAEFEGKMNEQEIERNPYFEDKTIGFETDINWMNGSKIYKLGKTGKFTFHSPFNLKNDFSMELKVNNLSEKNTNFLIGFAGEPLAKQNYTVGSSSSYLEWAISRDATIAEHNSLNRDFKGSIKIETGSILELKKVNDKIFFAHDKQVFEYSFKFNSENMFLICSMMFADEEIEISHFTYS